MKQIFRDFQTFYVEVKKQDFAFYMLAAYLVFSYMRPQVIISGLNVIPWTQITILAGLTYLIIKRRVKFTFAHFVLFLFGLVVLISTILSEYPDISFDRLDVIFIWLVEVIFFTSCIQSLKQYRLINIILFLIIFKMSFFGAKTWVGRGFGFRDWGIAGPDGFFANSGEFSLLMAMFAILSLIFILSSKKSHKFYYIFPLTAIMTVIGASSRGAQLSLLIALCVVIFAIYKLRLKYIFVALLSVVIIINVLPEEQKNRFLSAGEDSTSVNRLTYWKAGIEMMNKYKYFGVGYYTFSQYFYDHYDPPFESEYDRLYRKEAAHNSLIEVGSTLGYIGLICYLWLIYICYNTNRKTRRVLRSLNSSVELSWIQKYSIAIDGALIAYLIGSFFMSVAFYPYLYLLLMLSISLNNSVINYVPEKL